MSLTILEQILLLEENLVQAEKQFREAEMFEEKLRQQRSDGKLLYEGWRTTQDFYQWRDQQLERQKWQCACCQKPMRSGEVTYLPSGKFMLEPDHPTVDHILPKSYFPDMAFDKQNLVMLRWDCNRRKGSSVVEASRFRHQQLKQKIERALSNFELPTNQYLP